MRTIATACFLAAGLLMAGCSAEVDVVEMPNGGVGQTSIRGLPFRVHERHELTVWRRLPDGKFEQVHTQRLTIPDQDRLYLLRYRGLPFANASSRVKLRDDGTLERVEVSDVDSQAPEALTEIGKQITAVEEARQAREAAETTALAAESTAALEYYTALKAALDKQSELAALPPDDPTRPALERDLKLLQITANLKAPLADKDPPFPGVDF